MKLSQITIFKFFLFLFTFSIIITSCEPEEVPKKENQPTQQFDNVLGETGDQSGEIDEKKG